MGSDDFLEPGAMSAWVRHVRNRATCSRDRAHPHCRARRSCRTRSCGSGGVRRVDAAKDRLFYRTAPLGLIETAEMRRLGLRMTEGVRVGEDFEFGIRLWSLAAAGSTSSALRPATSSASTRASGRRYAPLALEDAFEPITRLLDDGLPAELTNPRTARPSRSSSCASAWSVQRSHVRCRATGAATTRSRSSPASLRRLLALAPGVLTPFNLHDRRVLDGLLAEPTVARVTADVVRSSRAGRRERWLTKNPLRSFGRESMLRRYVLYYLKRERKDRSS